MNRKEFLDELEERLIGISKEDKEEILQDYREHFKIGKKKKRTEAEISKSLGEPKEIAMEIRKELSQSNREELKTEAIEAWVVLKKFSKNIFNETKERINEISNKFDSRKISHWIWLCLGAIVFLIFIGLIGKGFFFFLILIILIFVIIDKIKKPKKKISSKIKIKKKEEKKSLGKLLLVLLFNILIFIWLWISLLCVVFGLFISGIALVVAGVLLIIFSIFSLIKYQNPLLKDLFFSFLFGGIGIVILGILFTNLFQKIIRGFFTLTKKYFKLNQNLIKK